MVQKADLPIAIAGAGIAGLAAAIGLARTGRSVRVVEKAATFDATGAGIQIGPNAVRALQAIGAWDAVEPLTLRPTHIVVRDGHSGKTLQRIDLRGFPSEFGAPYRVMHRADLHGALLGVATSLDQISIVRGAEVHSFHVEPDGAVALELSQMRMHASHLIAADGIRSRVRNALFRDAAEVALPFVYHRCLLPFSDVRSSADIDIECVNLWLCRGGHVVHYPVSGERVNIVVVSKDANRSIPYLFRPIDDLVSTVNGWATWSAFRVPPLKTWHQGPICVIGDAAHGTVPFLAQGGAMALEDAAHLAQSFMLPDPFASFEAGRKGRTERLDRQSMRMGNIYHMGGIKAHLRNFAMELVPDRMALASTRWIYT